MILMNLIKMSKIIDCLYIHKLFTKIYENDIKFIKFNLKRYVNIHINFIKTLYNFQLLADILFIGLFDDFTPYRPRSIRSCFFYNLY